MKKKESLSIYVPKSKLRYRPLERLTKLAEERDRPVNYLAVEAILQYLDKHEPLDATHDGKAISTSRSQVASKRAPRPATGKNESPAKPTEQPDERESEALQAVFAYATKVAAAINRGELPAYVETNERGDKIRVVISRVVPPDGTDMSTTLWREQFRRAVSQELSTLGWQIRGGNWFARAGVASRARSHTGEGDHHQPAKATGCLGLCTHVLVAASLPVVFAVDTMMHIGVWSSFAPVAVGLLLSGL